MISLTEGPKRSESPADLRKSETVRLEELLELGREVESNRNEGIGTRPHGWETGRKRPKETSQESERAIGKSPREF